jgi:hypothetical protein
MTKNGTAARLHNVLVVQSCGGWKLDDVMAAIRDAANGYRYPREWADGDIHVIRRGRRGLNKNTASWGVSAKTMRELREKTVEEGLAWFKERV